MFKIRYVLYAYHEKDYHKGAPVKYLKTWIMAWWWARYYRQHGYLTDIKGA